MVLDIDFLRTMNKNIMKKPRLLIDVMNDYFNKEQIVKKILIEVDDKLKRKVLIKLAKQEETMKDVVTKLLEKYVGE